MNRRWFINHRLVSYISGVGLFRLLSPFKLQAQSSDVPFTPWSNSLILTNYPTGVSVYKNGLRLKESLDFTHIGNQITFKDGQSVSKQDIYVVDTH